jgi:hypothetical protein
MSLRLDIRRPVHGSAGAVLAAILLAALNPAPVGAASSGGWNNLGHGPTATTPAINGKVETYLSVGNMLYVGGDFTNAGNIKAADHIAKWNGSKWAAIGSGLGDAASAVYSMAVDGNHVYAGGSFQNAGGDLAADSIAVYDGTRWRSLAHSTPGSPLDGPVFAMTIIGRVLYVGGGFDNANGIDAADSIAAYNMDTGHWAAMLPGPGELSTVSSIVTDGHGGLFVGSSSSSGNIAGIPQADYVAEWNGGTSWSALGANQAGTDGAITGRVRGLSRSGNNLYVVGDFTGARGIAGADYIARWDGAQWSAVGSGAFALGSTIRGVDAIGSNVVVVGTFANVAGNAKADGIAAFVNGHWTNVGSNAAGTDGPTGLFALMLTVANVGARLYVGGLDPQVGGSTMNAFGAWFRLRQPDALVSDGGSFVGSSIYNATGQNQTVTHSVARGAAKTFSLRLTNNGLITDTFAIKGPGSASGFAAAYLRGTTNITSQVVAGTYSFSLTPHSSIAVQLKVTVGNGVAPNTTHSWLVTQTSTGAGAASDTVKVVVKATS